jgi:hypothetical protein
LLDMLYKILKKQKYSFTHKYQQFKFLRLFFLSTGFKK